MNEEKSVNRARRFWGVSDDVEIDLSWSVDGEKKEEEYWIGETECSLYFTPFKTGLDYMGYKLSGREAVFVPVKFEEAVLNDNIGKFSEDELVEYSRFINSHTFYFNSNLTLEEWHIDYKEEKLNKDSYYLSTDADLFIRQQGSDCPVSIYPLVYAYLADELNGFKDHLRFALSIVAASIRQEEEK